MTLEQYIISWMVERGVPQEDAKRALGKYKATGVGARFKDDWSNDVSRFPRTTLSLITLGLEYTGSTGRLVSDESATRREESAPKRYFGLIVVIATLLAAFVLVWLSRLFVG